MAIATVEVYDSAFWVPSDAEELTWLQLATDDEVFQPTDRLLLVAGRRIVPGVRFCVYAVGCRVTGISCCC